MQDTRLAGGLALLGLIVIVVSLGADALGIGAMPGIVGWKQWLGAAGGAVLIGLGWWWRLRAGRSEAET